MMKSNKDKEYKECKTITIMSVSVTMHPVYSNAFTFLFSENMETKSKRKWLLLNSSSGNIAMENDIVSNLLLFAILLCFQEQLVAAFSVL